MNKTQDKQKDCNPCKIAGAVNVTLGICDYFNLDCKEVSQAIKENKTVDEFKEVVKNIKEKNEGVADEQLDEVVKIIDETMEKWDQVDDKDN